MTAAALLIWTLEDELEALLGGETGDCLVCGERVEEMAQGRIVCSVCGTVVADEGGEPTERLALADQRRR